MFFFSICGIEIAYIYFADVLLRNYSLTHSVVCVTWVIPQATYMARITTGVSDVCPECGVAPHSVEHLFNCSAHSTQLTVQDLWDNPAAVADFLNLDS